MSITNPERTDALTDLAGGRTRIGYNDDRQPKSWTLPSGLSITRGYVSNHNANGVQYNVSALNDSLGVLYTQTPKSLIGRRSNTRGNLERNYTYDRDGRLKSFADDSITAAQSGCGTAIIDPDTGATCATPGNTVQIHSATYSYDKVGNRTDAGTVMGSWNHPSEMGARTWSTTRTAT